jgi:hypothetical protein
VQALWNKNVPQGTFLLRPDPLKGPDRDMLVEAAGAFQASVMRKTIAFIARDVLASIDLALFPSRHFSRNRLFAGSERANYGRCLVFDFFAYRDLTILDPVQDNGNFLQPLVN